MAGFQYADQKNDEGVGWSDERVELLRRLWADGLSASQVAAELGAGITRNGVIGKIHRLGIAERAKTTEAPRPRVAKAPRQAQARAPSGGVGNLAIAFATPAPRLSSDEDVVIPISERVELVELRENMCRWPMGDPTSPEFRFCGGKSTIGGGPYCAYHARVAYQPSQDRRRNRERYA